MIANPCLFLANELRDKTDQQRIINDLGWDLGVIDWGGSPMDVWEKIIKHAWTDDPGDIVQRKFNRLFEFLDELYEGDQWKTDLKYTKLYWLINIPRIDISVWQELYKESSKKLEIPKTREALIVDLEDNVYVRDLKTHPILDFMARAVLRVGIRSIEVQLRHLAHQIAPILHSDLDKQKVDAIFERVQHLALGHLNMISVKTEGDLRIVAANGTSTQYSDQHSYTLVVIEESNDNPNLSPAKQQFFLHIEHNGRPIYPKDQDEASHRLSEIQEVVEKFLDKNNQKRNSSVQIEWFLPTRLLSKPIHTWIRIKETGRSYGEIHPIVIRSLERVCNVVYWNRCLQQWDLIKSSKKNQLNPVVHFADQANCDYKIFVRELVDRQCFCVGMKFVMQTCDSIQFFKKMLASGVPILFWLHKRECALSLERDIQEMIGKELSEFPRLLYQTRQKNASNKDHFSNHLSLLWDNPERIPAILKDKSRFRIDIK